MTVRTRHFLVVSALVVVVGLCTGLVAYYNSSLPARRLAIGPPELTYIPRDAALLAYADVREIMDSEFRSRLSDVTPANEGQHEFLRETGIDVERDVDTVLVGLTAGRGSVVLVRGRFDQSSVETRAASHGAIAEEYRGKRLFVAPPAQATAPRPAGPMNGPPALVFLEPGLVALGDAPTVRHAIDTAQGPDGIPADGTLMRSVSAVEGEGNAWLVGEIAALSQHAGGLGEHLSAQLPPLKTFALSARLDRNLNARLHAETHDSEAATQLRATINGILETGRMLLGRDPQMVNMLNTVRATGSGTDVEVAFVVSPELLSLLQSRRLVAPGGDGRR
jgi:hypothetical protein